MTLSVQYKLIILVIFSYFGFVYNKTSIYTEILSISGHISSTAKIIDHSLHDGPKLCARLCHRLEECVSFFENAGTGMCRLLSEVLNFQTEDLLSEVGWNYYAISKCKLDEGYIFDISSNLCYKYFKEALTVADATNTCQQDGGCLLRIQTEAQQNHISQYLVRIGLTENPTISGSRSDADSPWFYEDATPIVYFSWATTSQKAEPLNGRHCVKLKWQQHFRWGAARCNRHNHFICGILVYE